MPCSGEDSTIFKRRLSFVLNDVYSGILHLFTYDYVLITAGGKSAFIW